MADDAKKDEAKSQDAAPSTGRSSVALLVGSSALVMILTPLITIFAIRALARPAIPAASTVQQSIELPLPKVQVNVAETNGTRYAQIEVVVELSDKGLLPYFQNHSDEQPKGRLRRIMASVIRIVSSKDLDGLLSADAKLTLATEIREILNEELRAEEAPGLVTDVYFSGFLIQ